MKEENTKQQTKMIKKRNRVFFKDKVRGNDREKPKFTWPTRSEKWLEIWPHTRIYEQTYVKPGYYNISRFMKGGQDCSRL